jgi:nitroreductase
MNPHTLNVPAPDALNLLKSRRSGSAKAMTGPGPSASQVRELIACASRVPDHGKLTPWRFIVFEGNARILFGNLLVKALTTKEGTLTDERIAQERNRLLRAPTIIAVISRARQELPIPEWEQILSAGACCQTLCIAAHAMGFVANWITEWYAYDTHVHKELNLASNERIAGFIYIGHSQTQLVDRPRPAFDAITTFYRSE